MNYLIIIIVAVVAVLAFLFGFYRGYIRQSCWGGAVAGTVLVAVIVDRYADQFNERGIMMLSVAAASMIVLTILCQLVRRYIKKQVANSQKLSFYRQYDDRTENEELILVSLDKGDIKSYRKRAKRKFRENRGAWGIVDRIFGGITFLLNLAMAAAIILGLGMFIIDVANITVAYDALQPLYESPVWTHFGFFYCLDIVIATLLCMSIRLGYKSGLLSALGTLIVIALVGGAGYLAYHLAFNVEAFDSAAMGLKDGVLSGLLANIEPALNALNITTEFVARVVVAVGLFLIMLIIIIIIAIFIPHAVDKLRNIKFIVAIDGVLGAAVLTAVVFAVLIALGAFAYMINDLDAFARFNEYMNYSSLAKALYDYNILNNVAVIQNIPLRDWFGLNG